MGGLKPYTAAFFVCNPGKGGYMKTGSEANKS